MIIDELRKKEMPLIGLLITAKKIYKENFQTILITTLIIFFPISIVSEILTNYMSEVMSSINVLAVVENTNLFEQFLLSPEYKQMYTYNIIFMLIQVFFVPLGSMAVAKISRDYIYGGKTDYKSAILDSFSRGATLVIASVLFMITSTAGILLLIVPGIMISVMWHFYSYAIILNDKGPLKALKYSSGLVKGKWFKTAGIMFMFFAISYLFSMSIQYLFTWGVGSFYVGVIMRMILYTIDVFFFVATTVWYLNREELYKVDSTESV